MIPYCEENWLAGPASATRSSSSTSSTISNRLVHHWNEPEMKQLTAWKRYRYLVESMQSTGQKFDQKLVLEAIFRGNDLVYSANTNCNVP